MNTIDINCDMGEGVGNYAMLNDELLMDHITSANIACGFHAGNPEIMQRTVSLAHKKNVAIGAHPGFADMQGFGRKEMKVSPAEVYQIVIYQISALYGFVKAVGARLHHVKPHGALYNMAAKDAALANAIANAVFDFDPSLILYALAGSEMIKAADNKGLKTASEVFADRTYQDDGTLTPRTQINALIHSNEQMIAQVLTMIKHQQVVSVNGKAISIKADTLCLHGDGAHALAFAGLIRQELSNKAITVKVI